MVSACNSGILLFFFAFRGRFGFVSPVDFFVQFSSLSVILTFAWPNLSFHWVNFNNPIVLYFASNRVKSYRICRLPLESAGRSPPHLLERFTSSFPTDVIELRGLSSHAVCHRFQGELSPWGRCVRCTVVTGSRFGGQNMVSPTFLIVLRNNFLLKENG
jgi:hypothetical protein